MCGIIPGMIPQMAAYEGFLGRKCELTDKKKTAVMDRVRRSEMSTVFLAWRIGKDADIQARSGWGPGAYP